MQTHPFPNPTIEQAELQAVRDFLASNRDDLFPVAPARRTPRQSSTNSHVTVRHGITRARNRSASIAKSEA